MGTLKLNTTSGGSLSIQAADGASDNTLTLPAVTGGNIVTTADSGTITQGMIGSGVAGSGPAFAAYLSSEQSISSTTYTKVTFDTENFDTNSNYDNASNYRFTPTVEGYYQINVTVRASGTSATAAIFDLYKNGSTYSQMASSRVSTSSSQTLNGSLLVYMNGTTDYLEVYGLITASSPSFVANTTSFTAHLARAA